MKAPLFLRAKHWQIFVPMMVIPFVSMIVFMVIMVVRLTVEMPEQPGPQDLFDTFYFMPVFFFLCAGTQLLWLWNVAVNLRKYIHSPERKPRVKLFYITFFTPIIYMCIIPFLMVNYMYEMVVKPDPNPETIIPLMILLFFGNLTMMFCFLNNNYVVTKTLKMAELQRKVSFSDFVGDFFFMLIFPVAIWFLQPRINKIVNAEPDKTLGMNRQVREGDLLD